MAMEDTKTQILFRSLKASLGLFAFGFGVYLTILADIGVAPWEAFSLGLSRHLPLSYGDISVITSFIIVGIDLLMKESIGLGTLLDALIVGKSTDLFIRLDLFPHPSHPVVSLIILVAGMFVMSFTQYFYMTAALGCGPRDTLLVALGKRVRRIPIGCVSIAILLTVLAAGWALGGPVGLGTVITAFGLGVTMQLILRLVRFEPRDVRHQSLTETVRLLRGEKPGTRKYDSI